MKIVLKHEPTNDTLYIEIDDTEAKSLTALSNELIDIANVFEDLTRLVGEEVNTRSVSNFNSMFTETYFKVEIPEEYYYGLVKKEKKANTVCFA